MKYANLKALQKHLADAAPAHLASVYAIFVKEDGERRLAIDALLKTLGASVQQVVRINCDRCDMGQLEQELLTANLFGTRPIVLLELCEKITKTLAEALEKRFLTTDLAAFLIISGSGAPRYPSLVKQLERAGIILDSTAEKPWEREKSALEWTAKEALRLNKRLDFNAAQLLVKYIGTDFGALQQELFKLASYTGQRSEITVNDIRAICPSANHDTIWQLLEAILKRDGATALAIAQGLLEDSQAIFMLLRQMRTSFQTDAEIAALFKVGGTTQAVAERFPNLKGPILEKRIGAAQRYGLENLQKALHLIDATELRAKNSNYDSHLLFQTLIAKLTG